MIIPRILISSSSSSAGKTTVVCGILGALKNRFSAGTLDSLPAAIKCGPDFIDPLFHQTVLGIPTGSIDLFFTDAQKARMIFDRDTTGSSVAVCEGAMGYYDGMGAGTETASAYDTAAALSCPVIFVADVRGKSFSVCAELNGFLSFREKNGDRSGVRAIILNRCTAARHAQLAPVIERECGVPVIGYLAHDPRISLESRHLGLVTPDQIADVREKMDILAAAAADTIDIDAVLSLAQSAPPVAVPPYQPAAADPPQKRVRIALARDAAFCFYYRENLDLLTDFGADLIPFSPLTDNAVPPDCAALYLGGGYPELFPGQLTGNSSMVQSIRQFCRNGAPVFAECGGFLYLQSIGILPGSFANTGHLVRFGYCTVTAQEETLLCSPGERIRAHEFHYYDTSSNGSACSAVKPSGGDAWSCIQSCSPVPEMHQPPCRSKDHAAKPSIFAGFPHLYFPANESFAARFVSAARIFSEQSRGKSCSSCGSCSGGCSGGNCGADCGAAAKIPVQPDEHSLPVIEDLAASVIPADKSRADAAQQRWNSLAKPLGGLGQLEETVCRLCAVTGAAVPDISRRALAVFCADNGIVAEGVSQTGQHVTAVVAQNLCTGATSVCKMAAVAHADVYPVDIGMIAAVSDKRMVQLSVARGTRDFLREWAMTRSESETALVRGFEFARELASRGYGILATGEMGIGNTTTSSAVAAALLGIDPSVVTGTGAGLSAAGVDHKTAVIRQGLALHHPDPSDPVDVLAKVGGFDIAGMAGFFIGAAASHVPVIVDGFISAVAALAAVRLCPACKDALIASHVSAEKAGRLILDSLGLEPLVTAGMHLGEGTGCMTILPLLDMAVSVYRDMATFSDIKIEAYKPL
jgi:nicotinate-nucleotide--dimethylbenzimidazole phosphoribosyltransferase/cobyrinic acid a,c-diamide synthase